MPENVSPESENLTIKQERLITALLSGQTMLAAAQSVGIAEKTAHIWMKQAHVLQAYRAAQKHIFDEALSQLMLDVEDARSTLKGIMRDTEAPVSSRVRAAQIILEQAIEQHKTRELEERISELEQALQLTRGIA